jgi:uncharacterized RDD family membrane protein YckC
MWYYVENGQQRGPVTEEALEALHQAGTVELETLVWRQGLANWLAYREAKGMADNTAAAEGATGSATGTLGQVVCAECGKTFPADEVIRYGSASICANCKPLFVQKIKEGAKVGAGLEYAGFGTRFAAKFLDGLILWVFQMALGILAGLLIRTTVQRTGPNAAVIGLQLAMFVGALLFNLLYNCFFLGRFGATPGKMACKIKVVTPEGAPIGYGCAALRSLAEIVSAMICYIGYLMAAWDDEKRALHDRMCNTRVVKR